MTGTHAKLAPSAAARWIACPGSVRMQDGFEDVSSEASKEGTFAHTIAAHCLELGVDAKFFVGTEGEVEGSKFTFDVEMAEHVQTYLDVCDEIVEPGAEVFVERRVTLNEEVYGTADFVVVNYFADHPPSVDVVDLKFGAGVKVEAKNNAQGRIYALAACKTFGVVPATVRVHIVQPRHARGGHSFETLTFAELKDWAANKLARAAALSRHEDPPLNAGDHCKFCLAKAVCPKLKEHFDEQARAVFANEDLSVARTPPDPKTLTPEQLGRALDAFPLVEEWMSAVRKHAKQLAENGSTPVGYKLVRTTGHRKWIDEDRAERALRRRGHNAFAKPKLISPAQAEKLIGKDTVSKLARKPATGVKLVPESDERPRHDGLVFEDLGE